MALHYWCNFYVVVLVKEKLSLNFGGVAVEAGGEAAEKLALGIEPYLDDFARSQGASTWKSFPDPANWKTTMLEKLADPTVKILFNLDGPVEVVPGVQRRYGRRHGLGTPSDLHEPGMVEYNRMVRERAIVPNPFLR